MGFLDLFKKKSKKINIEKDKLEEWLSNASELILKDVNKELIKELSIIKKLRQELKQNLKKLEKGELINPDIPQREKQVMNGNRNNYILKTKLFLDDLKLPELDYLEIKEFCAEFEEKLHEFNENTMKGYFILKNYFETEMVIIANLIKKHENSVVHLVESMKHKKVVLSKTITVKIRELNNNTKEYKSGNNVLNALKKELDQAKKWKNELAEELDKLKKSSDYSRYKKLQNQKTNLTKDISELNNKINLNVFEKGLKKYMHVSKNKLILDYLEDPLKALLKDSEFEIVSIIEKMKKEIENNNIELKEKQKNVILKKELTKDYLNSIKLNHDKLKKELKETREKQDRLTIMMNYKDLEYKIDHNSEKISRLKQEINEKKHLLSHLNIEQNLKQLEAKLSDFSGDEVTIKK